MKKIGQKYWILFTVTPVLLILDQWTKATVHNTFRLGETIDVIPNFFNLTYVRNTGAAFGILATANPQFRIPFFIIIPLIALGAIGFVFKRLDNNDLKLSSSLAMVISGAAGNLIDRIRYNFVIDFLDFHWHMDYHFPAFNIADSAICVGVGLLMLDMLKEKDAPDTP